MTLSETEALLLEACRDDVSGVTAENWRDLMQLAGLHEVTPLVACHLRRHTEEGGSPELPAECRQEVERAHAISVIQQGLLAAELEAILSKLGVPALVLKGPGLAARYYPPGARLSRDIDLHIHAKDYPQARAALADLGYQVLEGYDESIQRRRAKDVAFIRADSDGKSWSAELHWRLTEPGGPEVDGNGVWSRAERVAVGGTSFLTTGPEQTLLLLALNLRKQRFARLKTACNVTRLVAMERDCLDWDRLHREAHRQGICSLLRHSLRLSAEVLQSEPAPFPECGRNHGLAIRALARIATIDALMADGRPGDRSRAALGLIPFVSLDNLGTSLHLGYERLTLSPEIASYYRSGTTNVYQSRRQYLQDTARRFVRAVQSLAGAR